MGQLTIYLPDATEKAVKAAARRAKKSVSAWLAQLAEGGEPRQARWPKGYEKVLGTWEGDFPRLDDPPPDDVAL